MGDESKKLLYPTSAGEKDGKEEKKKQKQKRGKEKEKNIAELHVLFQKDGTVDVTYVNWKKIGARVMERAYRAIAKERRRLKKLELRMRRLDDGGRR